MTDHGAAQRPQAQALEMSDTLDVPGELRRLAADYPAFRFRTQAGHDRMRMRWVAERVQGLDAGLHTHLTLILGGFGLLRLILRCRSAARTCVLGKKNVHGRQKQSQK